MSKVKIENPKVFISYAWSSKEYQEKVLAFATELIRDGIDVILDKWSLKEGNDTFAFMEQSVSDPTVTNVLILLDTKYEEKANGRSGGVGTETQIISTEVYNKVKQEKILPVIFERKEDGSIPKPVYLKSLLHFDLSNEENYDEEYQRLVRTLYGIETYKKPEMGRKPKWLETTSTVSTKSITAYSVLKTNLSEKVKAEKYEMFLSQIKDKILMFKNGEVFSNIPSEDYLSLYSETVSIRDEFLQLIQMVSYVDGGEKLIASKLEEILEELQHGSGYINEIQRTLLHEIFIYIIAMYYKYKNYTALSYTLTKSYFASGYYECNPQSFIVFYHYDSNIDDAVCKRDGKQYYSGTANYWIDNINIDVCSKNDFVFADVLCYNASVYASEYLGDWQWFPLTYVYGGYENKLMRIFAGKLKSKEHLVDAAHIFGYDDVKQFKEKCIAIENLYQKNELKAVRHSGAFPSAPLLCMYIKSMELGISK